jgi:hypothetical protein
MNAVAQAPLDIPDPYARWLAALDGKPLDLGARGDPPCGYYRFPIAKGDHAGEQEAVAIWRDPAGELCCARTIFGDGAGMTAMQIDEMFTSEHYAIPYELYLAVTDKSEPWPELYTTRLRTKEIAAGVVWTEEWSRARLAADPETHDEDGNPRAVMGDNDPPADLTPAQALAARIEALSKAVVGFLAKIGGKPTTKADADMVANYATKFKDFANEATQAHKVAKEPHLAAGRAVDSEWFPVRDTAEACRKKALALADAWMTTERARLAEEARKVNEAARREAEKAAAITGEAPAPVQEVAPAPVKIGTGRTVSQRTRKVWVVTDLPKFVAYLAAMEPPNADLAEVCRMLANRLGAAGVAAPGIEAQERSSAQ